MFAKTISQWEFDYGFFTNLLRINVPFIQTTDILPLDNICNPNMKTTSYIKLKFFL